MALYPRLLGRPALNVQIGVFGLLIVRSRCSCIGSPQYTPCTPTRPHLNFGHLFRVNPCGSQACSTSPHAPISARHSLFFRACRPSSLSSGRSLCRSINSNALQGFRVLGNSHNFYSCPRSLVIRIPLAVHRSHDECIHLWLSPYFGFVR